MVVCTVGKKEFIGIRDKVKSNFKYSQAPRAWGADSGNKSMFYAEYIDAVVLTKWSMSWVTRSDASTVSLTCTAYILKYPLRVSGSVSTCVVQNRD